MTFHSYTFNTTTLCYSSTSTWECTSINRGNWMQFAYRETYEHFFLEICAVLDLWVFIRDINAGRGREYSVHIFFTKVRVSLWNPTKCRNCPNCEMPAHGKAAQAPLFLSRKPVMEYVSSDHRLVVLGWRLLQCRMHQKSNNRFLTRQSTAALFLFFVVQPTAALFLFYVIQPTAAFCLFYVVQHLVISECLF